MFNSHSVDSLNLLCLTPSTKFPKQLPTHVLTRGGRAMVGAKTRPYLSHVARSLLCPAANIANLSQKPRALKFYSLSPAIKRLHFRILCKFLRILSRNI